MEHRTKLKPKTARIYKTTGHLMEKRILETCHSITPHAWRVFVVVSQLLGKQHHMIY